MRADFTPNSLLVSAGIAGATTGWLPSRAFAERFMAQLATGTAGSVALDGSTDGLTSAGQVGTWALDTASQQVVSPPIKVPYQYLRITVVSTNGTVNIGRGA